MDNKPDLIKKIRQRFPEYDNISDQELAELYVKKYPQRRKLLTSYLLPEMPRITVCVVDSGYFITLARRLAREAKKVYYCRPTDKEFLSIKDDTFGKGFQEIETLDGDEFLRPELIDKINLYIFPDIGYSHVQSHLRSIGKNVWGPFDATELELYRTKFLKEIEKLGLPVAPYKVCHGMTELREYLKTVKRKWIKVDRWRNEMETFFHLDYIHSESDLDHLSVVFGGEKESVDFVVQDEIKTSSETGCDAWTISGEYPEKYFQGYELKNKLYLASLLPGDEMPKPIIEINKAISPLFKKYGYNNFFATEIRIGEDGKYYFIDPTFRLPGMSGEQILENCSNLLKVIWFGSQGINVKPEFKHKFAATASAYYSGESEDEWAIVKVPKEIERYVVFSHCSKHNGYYRFPSGDSKDLGVVLGFGNTVIEALKHLKKNTDFLKDEFVEFKLSGFLDLLKSIRAAEKKGIKFSNDKLPEDSEIIKFLE